MLVQDRKAAHCVPAGRFGSAEHGVDAAAQPLAPGQSNRTFGELAPVVTRCVRRVDELVVLGRRPVAHFQEFPRAIEKARCEPPLCGWVEIGQWGGHTSLHWQLK